MLAQVHFQVDKLKSGVATKLAWAKNGTPHTLTSAADTLTISDLTAKTFNVFLSHTIGTGSAYQIQERMRFNSDILSNYAIRQSRNNIADVAATSDNSVYHYDNNPDGERLIINYVINISTQEKLAIAFTGHTNTSGNIYAPLRQETVYKWVNTSLQITSVSLNNIFGNGDFAIGSNLSALGEGTLVAVNIQNGTVFEETDTNRSYIWNSSTGAWTQL